MSARRKYLARAYEGFRDGVCDGPLPPEQAVEIHQAFMAGACSLFALMMRATDDQTDDVTPANVAFMEDINVELDEWGKSFHFQFLEPKGSG